MKIVVVGTGYVGLVTGVCLADMGLFVSCVDIDKTKIDKLKEGILPIYEPGLDEIVSRNFSNGRLDFSINIKDKVKDADVIFIAVGTPPDEDGSADLVHVLSVAKDIGETISKYTVVVTKSTVPVGTAEKVRKVIEKELNQRNSDVTFGMVSNPEFLKEGSAIDDFMKPDRIIIGVDSEKAENVMRKIYKPFLLNNHPCIFMDIKSAEMTKYVANSMLATKISFINDIANLCEILGVDINMVRQGIGSDSRIGQKFIYPGVGYGGSCFPKDVKALIKTAEENGYPLQVLKAVESVNINQKNIMFEKVKKYFGDLKNIHLAVWGLSFKPNTDDMREAPSLDFINSVLINGGKVSAYDPKAIHEASRILKDKIVYGENMYDILHEVDALVVMTEWPEFRIPDFEKISSMIKSKVIFDGRNIYDPSEMSKNGFHYESIGRKIVNQ